MCWVKVEEETRIIKLDANKHLKLLALKIEWCYWGRSQMLAVKNIFKVDGIYYQFAM